MDTNTRKHVLIYCAMSLLFWFANYAFVPYLSAYANTMTTSSVLIGVMLGAYGWAQLLIRIPIGILADKYDNRRVFVRIGCVLSGVTAIGFFLSPNVLILVLCRALSGVAASVWVPMSVLFNSYFDKGKSVNAMSLLNSSSMAGQLLCSIIAIPLVTRYGISSVFLLSAVVAIIPMTISMRLKEKPLQRIPVSYRELMKIGRSKWVLTISVMCVLSHIMTFATSSGFTPQLALALGAPRGNLAIIQLVFTSGGMAFSLLAPRYIISRYGARNSLIVLLILQSITTVIQPLMPSLSTLYIAVALNGAACGTCNSIMLGLVILPFAYERQSAAMGFFQSLYSLGIILGPMVAGVAMDLAGISAAFYIIGAIGMLSPAIGLRFLSDERKMLANTSS